MTTRALFKAISIAAVLVCVACHGRRWEGTPTSPGNLVVGSGNVVEEVRPVSPFSGVSLDGIGSVEITPGSSESLIVEAEDNILPYLRTAVVGQTLVISTDSSVSLQPNRPIVFHVTVRSIDRIDLIGVGNIRSSGLIGNKLTISAIGTGNIDCFNVGLQELDVNIIGVGSARTSGTTVRQRITLAGVGSYEGRNLQSTEASVSLQSVGSATVRVSGKLIARVLGSGCVFYIGEPQLDTSVTGTGCVSKID